MVRFDRKTVVDRRPPLWTASTPPRRSSRPVFCLRKYIFHPSEALNSSRFKGGEPMIRISFPALTILTSRLAVRAGLAHTAEARRTAFMRNSLFPSHLVAAHPRAPSLTRTNSHGRHLHRGRDMPFGHCRYLPHGVRAGCRMFRHCQGHPAWCFEHSTLMRKKRFPSQATQ